MDALACAEQPVFDKLFWKICFLGESLAIDFLRAEIPFLPSGSELLAFAAAVPEGVHALSSVPEVQFLMHKRAKAKKFLNDLSLLPAGREQQNTVVEVPGAASGGLFTSLLFFL